MNAQVIEMIQKIADANFCEKIMRKSEHNESIQVTDVVIRAATNKGDNYTSDMFRATVDYIRGNDKKSEKKTFIIKVEPMLEGIHKELISKTTLFPTEIKMMTDTLAKMNDILGKSNPLNGRGLYTQKDNPPLLVIEDLAPLGFRMADREAGLDMEHCLLAIRGLARFHASSIALCEKEPKQKTMYSVGMFNDKQPPEMRMFFIEGTRALGKEVATWPELDSRYADKILKLADHIYDKGCEACICNEDELNVINHGDFWVNNMLFKYDSKGKPIQHIFVDFQICLYSSPAIDLQYFFNTSLTDDMLTANEETLLQEYTRTLAETMSKSGCRTEPPSLERIKKMLNERALYGMIAAFTILPVLLVSKKDAKDLNELMADGKYENPAYKGAAYKKAMLRRLPKFEELGLLD